MRFRSLRDLSIILGGVTYCIIRTRGVFTHMYVSTGGCQNTESESIAPLMKEMEIS